MVSFSRKVRKYLENAGWNENRIINIDTFKNSLLENKYHFFKSTENFLQRFGYLHIVYPINIETESDLHFDVIQAINEIDPLWGQKNYYKRLGNRNICIIGQAHSDHLTLFMDDLGAVYGGFDDFLCFIANSGEEAIEAICLKKSFKEIQ